MTWQEKINDWRSRSETEKQKLAVSFAIIGTSLVFVCWLFMIALDLSAPIKTERKEMPIAIEVVSTDSQKNSIWQKIYTGTGEVVISIWQGSKIMADKLKKI